MLQNVLTEVLTGYSEKHKEIMANSAWGEGIGVGGSGKAYFWKIYNHLSGIHLDNGIPHGNSNKNKGIEAGNRSWKYCWIGKFVFIRAKIIKLQ